MNSMRITSGFASTFVFVTALALGACTSTTSGESAPAPKSASAEGSTTAPRSGHAQLTNEYVASAEVLQVDAAERVLTLRREDGEWLQLEVGESVRNFDQIQVGDRLRVRYAESLKATLLAPDARTPAAGELVAAERAAAGAKPSGGVGYAATVRVKIESIDRERDLVVFSLDSGELVTHRIATPEGRRFVSGLKVGDSVQLDYAEALAVSIEKT